MQNSARRKKQMSEREPDDTPKPADAPTRDRAPQPSDYYDDDATGYEIYKPEDDEEAEEGEG
jgi:hypothetical protein